MIPLVLNSPEVNYSTTRISVGGSVSRGNIAQHTVADAYECGNEPSGSVKCGEFLD